MLKRAVGTMEKQGPMDDKVPISLVHAPGSSGVPLVFSIAAIKRLRELGVAGILTGTLPAATQQNAFLGIPLRLMIEEAAWLVEEGFAYLVCGGKLLEDAVGNLGAEDVAMMQKKAEESFEEQRAFKRQQHIEKLQRLGITKQDGGEEDSRLLEASLFVETKNESTLLKHKEAQFDIAVLQKKIVDNLLSHGKNHNDYLMYRALRSQGYFLSPGARFGGRFIAYPGDPLRYHSHLTVQACLDYRHEPLDLLQLVSGGRLGTGVKKLWVVGGVKDDEEIEFFSVEWAGFG